MFYENLKKELEKNNTNLNQLAKATGINQSATSRYKSGGMPTVEVLIKICEYLNVSADYLLDLNPTEEPELSDQERRLLEYYRKADARGKSTIEEIAKKEAAYSQENELYTSKTG